MKVVFIIPFSPKYENITSTASSGHYIDCPSILNGKGEAILFPKRDWGGLIGEHVIEEDPSIRWEVWRPDYRADKIYEHVFEDGLVMKSFPVSDKVIWQGMKRVTIKYSKIMQDTLCGIIAAKPDTAVLLPSTVEFSRLLHLAICKHTAHVLYYHFLNADFMFPQIAFSLNPLKLMHRIAIYQQETRRIRLIQNFQAMHAEAVKKFLMRYSGKKAFLARIGIDLSFWQNQESSEAARIKASLPADKFIFLLSQRLAPEYQLDKWMEALSKVTLNNYHCVITGTGPQDYADYLSGLVSKYKLEDKVSFVGFVSNELLRTYITACDCFAMSGGKGGGSTGAIYAMAMNRLVLHPDSGVAYEIMREHKAGVIIDSYKYNDWPIQIEDLINNPGNYYLVPPEYVVGIFNWKNCSRQWIEAINSI